MDNTKKMLSAKPSKHSRLTKGDVIFEIFNCIFLGTIAVIILYPLIYVISASISDPLAVASGRMFLWPVDFTTENYAEVFKNDNIMRGYRNSLIIMFGGTALNLVMTILAAFPMSRKDLWGRNVIMKLMTFCMFFSGGMIPTYLMVGKTLGLINSWLALILPGAISVYNMIVTRTFMQNIPNELSEAAAIDGCSDFKYFISILLPLSKAVISVISLYYAVSHWNSYFGAMIYLSDRNMFPLQLFLRDILVMNTIDASSIMDPEEAQAMEGMRDLLKYAMIVVSTVPILMVYPFIQKYFAKGVMVGSVKG